MITNTTFAVAYGCVMPWEAALEFGVAVYDDPTTGDPGSDAGYIVKVAQGCVYRVANSNAVGSANSPAPFGLYRVVGGVATRLTALILGRTLVVTNPQGLTPLDETPHTFDPSGSGEIDAWAQFAKEYLSISANDWYFKVRTPVDLMIARFLPYATSNIYGVTAAATEFQQGSSLIRYTPGYAWSEDTGVRPWTPLEIAGSDLVRENIHQVYYQHLLTPPGGTAEFGHVA